MQSKRERRLAKLKAEGKCSFETKEEIETAFENFSQEIRTNLQKTSNLANIKKILKIGESPIRRQSAIQPEAGQLKQNNQIETKLAHDSITKKALELPHASSVKSLRINQEQSKKIPQYIKVHFDHQSNRKNSIISQESAVSHTQQYYQPKEITKSSLYSARNRRTVSQDVIVNNTKGDEQLGGEISQFYETRRRRSSKLLLSGDSPERQQANNHLNKRNNKSEKNEENINSSKNQEKPSEVNNGNQTNSNSSNDIMSVVATDLATFALASLFLTQQSSIQEQSSQFLIQKLINTFGITRQQIEEAKGEEEKKQLIVNSLMAKVKEQYDHWQIREEQRRKDIDKIEEEQEENILKKKAGYEAGKKQFSWMKVNTKYSYLEDTLKNTLIMKINNFYNQSFLQDKILQNKGLLVEEDSSLKSQKEDDEIYDDDLSQYSNNNSNLIKNNRLKSASSNSARKESMIIGEAQNYQKQSSMISLDATPIKTDQSQTYERSSVCLTERISTKKTMESISAEDQHHYQIENRSLLRRNSQDEVQIKKSKRNSILFCLPERSEETHIKISSKGQQIPAENTSSSVIYKSLSTNDLTQQQTPLQNLYQNIQTKRKTLIESPLKQLQPSEPVAVEQKTTQKELLKNAYNQSLNKFIESNKKQSKPQSYIRPSEKEQLYEKVESNLQLGQKSTDCEMTVEYRWLKEGMVRGLNSKENNDMGRKLLKDNFFWNQVLFNSISTFRPNFIYVKETEGMLKRTLQKNNQQDPSNQSSSLTTFEFMRLLIKNETSQNIDRDNLMKKYQEGERLSEDQMDFLAATNSLLNKFIDKEFIEDAISILEKSGIIDTMEIVIAEGILKSYNTIKTILSSHRQIYLAHKNSFALQKVATSQENTKKEKNFELSCEKHKKKTEMFRAVLKSISKKQQQTENAINNLNSSRSTDEPRKQIKNNDPLPKKLQKFSIYHPPQKLFMADARLYSMPEESTIDNTQKSASKWFSQKKQSKTKIEKVGRSSWSSFQRFYSGGPLGKIDREINEKDHLQQILKIQGFGKIIVAKSILKEMKEALINKQKKLEFEKSNLIESTQNIMNTPLQGSRTHKMSISQSNQIITNTPLQSSRPHKVSIDLNQNVMSTPLQSNRPHKSSISQQNQNTINNATSNSNWYLMISKQELQNKSAVDQTAQQLSSRRESNKLPQKSDCAHQYNKIQDAIKHKVKQLKRVALNQKDSWRTKEEELIQGAKENTLTKSQLDFLNLNITEINHTDYRQNTALYYATNFNNVMLAKSLLKRGALINQQCEGNNSALHIAFKLGHIGMILELLSNGGNIILKNSKGESPLDLAKASTLKNHSIKKAVESSLEVFQGTTQNHRDSFQLEDSRDEKDKDLIEQSLYSNDQSYTNNNTNSRHPFSIANRLKNKSTFY